MESITIGMFFLVIIIACIPLILVPTILAIENSLDIEDILFFAPNLIYKRKCKKELKKRQKKLKRQIEAIKEKTENYQLNCEQSSEVWLALSELQNTYEQIEHIIKRK